MGKKYVLVGVGIFLASVFVFTHQSSGESRSSIFLAPAEGTFTIGGTFTVSIFLNTAGQSVNAIEADIGFPPDKLQVVAPTAGKSIIQVWVNQPTYSNSEGTIKFQGAMPSPGINTDAGLLSTITFRVKSVGTAALKVLDSSRVLLNDGKGTDVLGDRAGAIYSFTLPPPAGPLVSSQTNPDQEKWYASKSVALKWENPPEIQGFSYILNGDPVDEPDDISEGTRGFVSYKDLADGTYYFHIKLLRAGVWGGVTNYAVNIDNKPPAAFNVEFSPGPRTSNRRPIINFETTDAVSGIDHYELKIISLNPAPAAASAARGETPFFIEAHSPYSTTLELGRYDVVVRAFDRAGNNYQATGRLTIASGLFQVIEGEGLKISGTYTIPWVAVWILAATLLFAALALARHSWMLHKRAHHELQAGPSSHPAVIEKLEILEKKQKEYGGEGIKSLIVFGLVATVGFAFFAGRAIAAEGANPPVPVEPPIVTLFPNSLSNDEILYVGGRAGAPFSDVLIYFQDVESGSTMSHTVKTDKTGAWFYSFPQFFDPGHYVLWTQLKVDNELSPPSSKTELEIARTAVRFGGARISFERLYLILLAASLALLAVLAFTAVYHARHARKKRRRLLEEIRLADDSIRRGFAILRRDIEMELEAVRKAKHSRDLSEEEKMREEKLMRDLEFVRGYVGKEIWEINRRL